MGYSFSYQKRNHFLAKLKDRKWASFKLQMNSIIYVCIILCIYKCFLKNYYLIAISNVDVNFDQLQVQFTWNPSILSDNEELCSSHTGLILEKMTM